MNAAFTIRDALAEEAGALGRLMVQVYSQLDGFPTPVEQPRYYELLANETERLHRMVESLLSFGRIEVGAYAWNLQPTGTAQFVKENVNIGVHLLGDRRPEGSADAVAPGEGKVVNTDRGNIALYRDENGVAHRLSPLCTHMGCYVQWNPAEKSWDCPCHGSRFSCEGKVIQGPAIKDMETIEDESSKLDSNP